MPATPTRGSRERPLSGAGGCERGCDGRDGPATRRSRSGDGGEAARLQGCGTVCGGPGLLPAPTQRPGRKGPCGGISSPGVPASPRPRAGPTPLPRSRRTWPVLRPAAAVAPSFPCPLSGLPLPLLLTVVLTALVRVRAWVLLRLGTRTPARPCCAAVPLGTGVELSAGRCVRALASLPLARCGRGLAHPDALRAPGSSPQRSHIADPGPGRARTRSGCRQHPPRPGRADAAPGRACPGELRPAPAAGGQGAEGRQAGDSATPRRPEEAVSTLPAGGDGLPPGARGS